MNHELPLIHFNDLGTIEYGEAWAYQESLLKENLNIKAKQFAAKEGEILTDEATQNHLLFCTHPHVYTLGKSGHESHLLANEALLANINATYYKTNRGGDITYHGPGQIVGYPIFDLEYFFTDLGKYMRSLEEIMIRTIARYGITGGRLEGATGVWLDWDNPAKARKICAMGVRSSRWVTMHGFALNVNTDLSYFGHIVPCGIVDKGVTSMQRESGHEIDEAGVKEILKKEFASVFGAVIEPVAQGASLHAISG